MDIQQKIKNILKKIDINQDREDAESKAIEIYQLGPDALDILIKLAKTIGNSSLDVKDRRKFMRAIILAVTIFAQKKKSFFTKSEEYNRAIMLLSELSCMGFNSATSALKHLGLSEADFQKKVLLSLPLHERHSRDKVVSLSEALEEIKISAAMAGTKGVSDDHYRLGQDERHQIGLYRISKNLFGIRTRKK